MKFLPSSTIHDNEKISFFFLINALMINACEDLWNVHCILSCMSFIMNNEHDDIK